MPNFRNFRDGRQDGRASGQGANDNEQAPKCVRPSLASRLTRSLRRRMPSRVDTNARGEVSNENIEPEMVLAISPTTVEPTAVARPRRRSVAADRRASICPHPYSYRRSEYLNNDIQAVFMSSALSPKDTANPPAEVLADLLQVDLQPYDRKYFLNRRLRSGAQQEYLTLSQSQDASFFDYDTKNEPEDFLSFFESLGETTVERETGFRMIYPLSDEGHGSDSNRSSWFSEFDSTTSDTDSQVSLSPRGSQLSIIRAASLASLKN